MLCSFFIKKSATGTILCSSSGNNLLRMSEDLAIILIRLSFSDTYGFRKNNTTINWIDISV